MAIQESLRLGMASPAPRTRSGRPSITGASTAILCSRGSNRDVGNGSPQTNASPEAVINLWTAVDPDRHPALMTKTGAFEGGSSLGCGVDSAGISVARETALLSRTDRRAKD